MFSSVPSGMSRCRLFGVAAALLAAAGVAQSVNAQCTNFVVTTSTGAAITPGTTDIGNYNDDGAVPVALPFAFNYQGTMYSSINVDSNGVIEFVNSNSTYTNSCTGGNSYGPAVMAFWDDLYLGGGSAAGQGVFTTVTGTSPNQDFYIEYRAQFCCDSSAPVNNFEVVLHEAGGFDIIYTNPLADPRVAGNSATIGYQDAAGNLTVYSCNTGSLTDGEMISFGCPTTFPPTCRLAANPSSGPESSSFLVTSTVTPGGGPVSTGLTASVDASSMALGTVTLYDDGPGGGHGDVTAGDNIFSNMLTVPAGTAAGQYALNSTVMDDQGRTSTCSTNFVVSAGNDDCGGAIPAVLGDNFFDNSNATTSTPAASCGLLGNDLWYTFSTPTRGDLTVTTCGLTTSDTAIAIFSDCNTEIACDDDSACGLQSTLTICAEANTTYYLRIGGFNGNIWTGSFNVSLDTNTHPPYAAPADSVAEAEPCSFDLVNDTVDGGCNSTPPVYATLNYCTDYSGTCENGWVDPATGFSYRDTDWYQFTVESFDNLTITGQCQFTGYLWIIQEPCPGTVMGGFPVAIGPTTGGCSPSVDFSTTTSLGAGTYDLAIMPQSFYGDVQCGTNEQYWFRVQTDAGCGPVCGSADFNCDGDVGTDADISAFFNCLAGNCPSAPCTSTADFNGDGDVGTDADIAAFFRVLGGGSC